MGGGESAECKRGELLMSVSTLAGTTWVINSNPRTNTLWSHCGTYNINYHFGGISYGSTVATATTFIVSGMGPPEDPSPILFSLQGACSAIDGEDNISPADYVSTMETAYDLTGGYIGVDGYGVYHGTDLYYYDDSGNAPWDGWTLSNRTIEIIDGAAATNANLIAWFEANATQQIVDVDYLTTTSEITSIANAIRTKGGTSASLVYPTGFVTAIQNLPSGGSTPTQTKSVSYSSNNTYTVTPDTGYALSQVNVTVAVPPGTHRITLKNTGHSTYVCVQYNGNTYYQQGYFDVPDGATVSFYTSAGPSLANMVYFNGASQTLTSNAYAWTATSDAAVLFDYSLADHGFIRVATNGYVYTQTKTVVSNGTVTADNGYDGLGTVTVNIPVYDGSVS